MVYLYLYEDRDRDTTSIAAILADRMGAAIGASIDCHSLEGCVKNGWNVCVLALVET